jgi:hypothetical protein
LESRDLIVTPIIIMMVYFIAYFLRPLMCNSSNHRYFFPALTAKIIGALCIGLVYQFYYSGGDTFNYHTIGSRHIWEGFVESPDIGIRLLFGDDSVPGGYAYSSRIYFFRDPASFTIVQIAALFDLITFSAYSATAVLFAFFCFIGSWMMFLAFCDRYQHLERWLAISILFIPSVVFWGSGLLKDTITFGCSGIMLYSTYFLFIKKKYSTARVLIMIGSMALLYRVKIYILLAFLPALILWIFFENLGFIRNKVLRGLAAPAALTIAIALAYFAAQKAGEDNPRYSLNKIGQTAQVTANDILYVSGRGAGSGYSLGKLDGSFGSMVKLAPQAINVSLFRPYLWEVGNPLMLLSALEALFFLSFTFYTLFKCNAYLLKGIANPTVIFCLVYSLVFAFAVGVSTFNFGTLVRYKIPMLPFYLIALIILNDEHRKALRS